MAELKGTLSPTRKLLVKPLTAGTGTQTVTVVEKDYNELINKPKISGRELIGDLTIEDIGVEVGEALTNIEIENLINSIAY